MIPFVIPLGAFLALLALRRNSRVAARYTPSDAAAWSLSALLLLTGSAHFVGLRQDLIHMVPPGFPRPDLIVTATGVLELLGAAALLYPRSRCAAGVALALLFVALLPANIHAAREGLTLGGKPVTPLALRIPEQLLFIGLALFPLFVARQGKQLRRADRPV